MTLFVVACSQRKHLDLRHRTMAARDAYIGTGFRIARRQLETTREHWCILSGHYGFLWPDSLIEHYDEKIDPDPKRPWAAPFDSLKQKQYGRLMSAKEIIVLGSRLYVESAAELLGRGVESPLVGLPIGRALHYLSKLDQTLPRRHLATAVS